MVQIDHIFFIWPSADGHLGWLYNHFCVYFVCAWGFRVVLVVKNLPANSGDIRDVGSTPGLGRSPGGGHGNHHSSILAWWILWPEEPGRLQSMGWQRVRLPVIPELWVWSADCLHYLHVHLTSSDNLSLSVVREHLGFTFEPRRRIPDQDWTLHPAQGTLWPRLPSVFPQPQDHTNVGGSMRERWKDLTKSN